MVEQDNSVICDSDSEAETGRIFYSPLRLAPLSQGIFTNSTDTKDRNGKDFLLPTPLCPEKSFPRLAPPRLYFLFFISASPRPDSPPRFGLCPEPRFRLIFGTAVLYLQLIQARVQKMWMRNSLVPMQDSIRSLSNFLCT